MIISSSSSSSGSGSSVCCMWLYGICADTSGLNRGFESFRLGSTIMFYDVRFKRVKP